MSGRLPIEVWGGIECTTNRVGDQYFDQLERGGHCQRPEDIDLIASLGIRTLRYPVLWERTAPDSLSQCSWEWADQRLNRMRSCGVDPIVGLLHHGSGPRYTALLDDGFVDGLAQFAGRVAERYPWVTRWTPINEPLTTARFSTLYGHWYPHLRDDVMFARAIVRQCRAVAGAMRRIREEIPEAQLVQTEDLGKAYATPQLQYQADFENERRWLTFDLLCGRVDRSHPLWSFLARTPHLERELDALAAEPCVPDTFGINHYVTSERFLDDRLEGYPQCTHGGNGRTAYADVEAARVRTEGIRGPGAAIADTWERYRRPLAITEAHLAGTREQQLRWLQEVWSAAIDQKALGVDMRAVTVWSLFGAHDWHNLVTRGDGHYESGAFDVRAPRPRPTALAHMTRELVLTHACKHPVLGEPGWWHRDDRLLGSAVAIRGGNDPWRRARNSRGEPNVRPIVITGATGTLGRAFTRLCRARQLTHVVTSRQDMDISNPAQVAQLLGSVRPWAVINAAGFVRVDDAEFEPEACDRDNCVGPRVLADACARRDIPLVTFSSDLVFDGGRTTPYVESDKVKPLGTYGLSKAAAERVVRERYPAALIVRTSAFFGPWDPHNFVTRALHALSSGTSTRAACDQVISPTYVPDLVNVTLDLLIDGEQGVWHLANAGAVTWVELAQRAAALMGLDPALVIPCSTTELELIAARPTYCALGSERGVLLPGLDDALARYAYAKQESLWAAKHSAMRPLSAA